MLRTLISSRHTFSFSLPYLIFHLVSTRLNYLWLIELEHSERPQRSLSDPWATHWEGLSQLARKSGLSLGGNR